MSLPTFTSIPCMAGRLKNFVSNWETTSDQRILEAIRGVTIDFYEYPSQQSEPSQYKFNPSEVKMMNKLKVFFQGESLRRLYTSRENIFQTFSYDQRKMGLISLFSISNNLMKL